MIKQWFKSGSPWIWLNAAAVSTCLILVVGLLALIVFRGALHFWPSNVAEFIYMEDGRKQTVIGEVVDTSSTTALMARASGHAMADDADLLVQHLIKIGNRDLTGMDFRWILDRNIQSRQYPDDILVIERREWGNFYGYPVALKQEGQVIAEGPQVFPVVSERLRDALSVYKQIQRLEKKEIGAVNYGLERLRLKQRRLELNEQWDEAAKQLLAAERGEYERQYREYQTELQALYKTINRNSLVVKASDGREVDMPLAKLVRIYRPNTMSVWAKTGHYFEKIAEFLLDDPREANTEGGIFPAIFGTVMMVIIMSVIVTPLGVIAAIYMREYAKQGFTTRLIRIAVNNLAGVPSIVYGVFGLGFFVYILGGNIDQLFFPEAAPAPVFGTPGLLWASITLALLTLPVVIVSTEEGLSRIPKSIREGSLALGATKAETLWRTVLPMASPAMMTGLILAVARAAGEVAPLMLVGVVKLAPSLPLDGNFPFLHLDRKFMHLGFHIYDVGFQSPNVEAARPLVYATSLLLVVVIVGLNLSAVAIRNHLREKYRALEG
ncbi:phosphate ABC transporter permease PstA [Methylotuvimicrobium alcaliphilum]|uniref:Phosphate transport system permease protein PstA n=1 Tax=Methylotuvimicrobium alcaliphilum (strain DSM 19304 / NCIMB 14124 / VKM B-2133 / 20Z) TaxID=1091494 RepID=G4SWB4_META2|nr:phosphate ABC transporter permease PstA [Methylotuvimicrobium alcaliphilum]CCE23029.1 putative ABC-type phosphate transport system, auxiliary and permease component [Methylotuvimicrobium alcaliphilum 20Z]